MINGLKHIKYIQIHESTVLLKKKFWSFTLSSSKEWTVVVFLIGKYEKIVKHLFCNIFQGTQIVRKGNKYSRPERISKSVFTTPKEALIVGNNHPWLLKLLDRMVKGMMAGLSYQNLNPLMYLNITKCETTRYHVPRDVMQ